MAVVPVASKNSVSAVAITPLTLATSGDTLQYVKNQNQELYLFNPSASAVTVTIDGDGANAVLVPGTAGTTISVASGLAINVPANSFAFLPLDRAEVYLVGNVSITASVGAVVRATVVSPY